MLILTLPRDNAEKYSPEKYSPSGASAEKKFGAKVFLSLKAPRLA